MIISRTPQDNYLYKVDKYNIKKRMMKKEMHRIMEDEIILFLFWRLFLEEDLYSITLQ